MNNILLDNKKQSRKEIATTGRRMRTRSMDAAEKAEEQPKSEAKIEKGILWYFI